MAQPLAASDMRKEEGNRQVDVKIEDGNENAGSFAPAPGGWQMWLCRHLGAWITAEGSLLIPSICQGKLAVQLAPVRGQGAHRGRAAPASILHLLLLLLLPLLKNWRSRRLLDSVHILCLAMITMLIKVEMGRVDKSATLRSDNRYLYCPLGHYFAHLPCNIHNHRLSHGGTPSVIKAKDSLSAYFPG